MDEVAVRAAAMNYLDACSEGGNRPVTWRQLNRFVFQDEAIILVSTQGIFKPRQLSFPISIRTAPPRPNGEAPYTDEISVDGFLQYRYRGVDVNHRDNVGLREAMKRGLALIYLVGVAKGLYDVSAAAIIGDRPGDRTFEVALFPIADAAVGTVSAGEISATTRQYYYRIVKQRAQQAAFRVSVLDAYRKRCTICRLGHVELLDAAHIIPDALGGQPVIPNGVALCKIHHAAYDANIVGIRPDYVAEVRTDILAEVDGPMLQHGIKEIHGQSIHVPASASKRPNRLWLDERYERFRSA